MTRYINRLDNEIEKCEADLKIEKNGVTEKIRKSNN